MESIPFYQILDYKEIFRDKLFRRQDELSRVTSINPLSYFNTLPSGDLVSDTEFDTFLCDQMFQEDFEFTVADEMSNGITTLHNSLSRVDVVALNFLKPTVNQTQSSDSKLKKLNSFHLGDRFFIPCSTGEAFSQDGLNKEPSLGNMGSFWTESAQPYRSLRHIEGDAISPQKSPSSINSLVHSKLTEFQQPSVETSMISSFLKRAPPMLKQSPSEVKQPTIIEEINEEQGNFSSKSKMRESSSYSLSEEKSNCKTVRIENEEKVYAKKPEFNKKYTLIQSLCKSDSLINKALIREEPTDDRPSTKIYEESKDSAKMNSETHILSFRNLNPSLKESASSKLSAILGKSKIIETEGSEVYSPGRNSCARLKALNYLLGDRSSYKLIGNKTISNGTPIKMPAMRDSVPIFCKRLSVTSVFTPGNKSFEKRIDAKESVSKSKIDTNKTMPQGLEKSKLEIILHKMQPRISEPATLAEFTLNSESSKKAEKMRFFRSPIKSKPKNAPLPAETGKGSVKKAGKLTMLKQAKSLEINKSTFIGRPQKSNVQLNDSVSVTPSIHNTSLSQIRLHGTDLIKDDRLESIYQRKSRMRTSFDNKCEDSDKPFLEYHLMVNSPREKIKIRRQSDLKFTIDVNTCHTINKEKLSPTELIRALKEGDVMKESVSFRKYSAEKPFKHADSLSCYSKESEIHGSSRESASPALVAYYETRLSANDTPKPKRIVTPRKPIMTLNTLSSKFMSTKKDSFKDFTMSLVDCKLHSAKNSMSEAANSLLLDTLDLRDSFMSPTNIKTPNYLTINFSDKQIKANELPSDTIRETFPKQISMTKHHAKSGLFTNVHIRSSKKDLKSKLNEIIGKKVRLTK